ncbi:hypothetical protein J7K18_06085 [bacterium]|nr:hypothetical protein [bacterium]
MAEDTDYNGTELGRLERKYRDYPNSDAFIGIARLYYKQGNVCKAFDVLKEGIAKRPDIPEAQIAFARIAVELRRFGDAILALRECLIRDPANFKALLYLLQIYLARHDQENARQTLLFLLSRHPDDSRVRKFQRIYTKLFHDNTLEREVARRKKRRGFSLKGRRLSLGAKEETTTGEKEGVTAPIAPPAGVTSGERFVVIMDRLIRTQMVRDVVTIAPSGRVLKPRRTSVDAAKYLAYLVKGIVDALSSSSLGNAIREIVLETNGYNVVVSGMEKHWLVSVIHPTYSVGAYKLFLDSLLVSSGFKERLSSEGEG